MTRMKHGLKSMALSMLAACGPSIGEGPSTEGGTSASSSASGSGSATMASADGEVPPECAMGGWQVFDAVLDEGLREAEGLAVVGPDLYLADANDFGGVSRVDRDGNVVWVLHIVDGFLHDVIARPDGGAYVMSTEFGDPADYQMGIAAVSADGNLEWSNTYAPGYGAAWGHSELHLHPQGGIVASWYGGLGLTATYIDDAGTKQWTSGTAVYGDIAINWSHSAMDLMPGGDILQLTADFTELRLIRISIDGTTISDATIAGYTLWPKDVEVLPDGTIFVLGNSEQGPQLLEVSADGDVLGVDTFPEAPDDAFGDALLWDEDLQRLLLVGQGRFPAGQQQRDWTRILDRDGVVEFDLLQTDLDYSGTVLDLDVDPGAGFVISRHGFGLRLGLVQMCGT